MTKNNGSIGSIKTDLTWIKKILEEMQEENKNNNDKLDEVCIGFKNHLTQHEQLRREMFTKLGLFVTCIGIIASVILKLWLG